MSSKRIRTTVRQNWLRLRGWSAIPVTRMSLGECPRWTEDGKAIWWIDITEGALHNSRLAEGTTETNVAGSEAAALAIDPSGMPWIVVDGILMCLDNQLAAFLQKSRLPLADLLGQRANDAAWAPNGELWITTMDRNGLTSSGALLSYSPFSGFRDLQEGFTIANGPVFDALQRIAYVADSPKGIVYRISLDTPELREPFLSISESEGYPDGMAIDSAGNLWIAHYGAGRLTCWSSRGERLATIPTPCTCPTAVAVFDQANSRQIAVTSVCRPGELPALWVKRYGI